MSFASCVFHVSIIFFCIRFFFNSNIRRNFQLICTQKKVKKSCKSKYAEFSPQKLDSINTAWLEIEKDFMFQARTHSKLNREGCKAALKPRETLVSQILRECNLWSNEKLHKGCTKNNDLQFKVQRYKVPLIFYTQWWFFFCQKKQGWKIQRLEMFK